MKKKQNLKKKNLSAKQGKNDRSDSNELFLTKSKKKRKLDNYGKRKNREKNNMFIKIGFKDIIQSSSLLSKNKRYHKGRKLNNYNNDNNTYGSVDDLLEGEAIPIVNISVQIHPHNDDSQNE